MVHATNDAYFNQEHPHNCSIDSTIIEAGVTQALRVMHGRIAHVFLIISGVEPGKTPVVAVLADTLIEIVDIKSSDSELGWVSHWGTLILKVALLASGLER